MLTHSYESLIKRFITHRMPKKLRFQKFSITYSLKKKKKSTRQYIIKKTIYKHNSYK